MKQKRLSNGDLFFMYGFPDHVEGYIQNPQDPFHFIQQKPPCTLRGEKKCGTCRNPVIRDECTIGRPLDCVECDERVEPDESPESV